MTPNMHKIPPFHSAVKMFVAENKVISAGEFQDIKYFPLT